MRGFALALALAAVLGCETSSQSCMQHGGVCAVTCPANTEPLSAAQFQNGTGDYGCPVDGGLIGAQCCLPAPVTN